MPSSPPPRYAPASPAGMPLPATDMSPSRPAIPPLPPGMAGMRGPSQQSMHSYPSPSPAPVAVPPHALLAPPAAGGQGRVAEEQSCMRTILQCLDAAMRAHSAPIMPGMPLPTHGAASLEEAAEYFELIVSLLGADTHPFRIMALAFDTEPSCVDVLISVLSAPTPAHQVANPPYAHCRVLCVQTLTKVLSMCTAAAASPSPVPGSLPQRCLSALDARGFIPFALAHLAPTQADGAPAAAPLGGGEAVRVAVAECLFVLVMRVDGASAAVARAGGARMLSGALFSDPSVMVRNYACAILRVLAERAPAAFADLPLLDRAVAQIKQEHSKYVVILLFEILALLFAAFPDQYLVRCHDDAPLRIELFRVVRTFLAGNANPDVLTAVVRVVETVFLLEGRTAGQRTGFITAMLAQDGWKPLLARDPGQPAAVRLLRVRALRRLAQSCTSPELCEQLHDSFTHLFPSLSLLLNADAQAAPPAGDEDEERELRMETALCFAVLLAKSPRSREYAHDTIRAYPVWMGQLRERLVAALDATPALLNSVFIIDATASWLNDVRQVAGVDWGDRRVLAAVAARMFAEQEQKYAAGPAGPTPTFLLDEEEAYAVDASMLPLREQKARLTHALLAHAVHAALTPPAGAPVPPPAAHAAFPPGMDSAPFSSHGMFPSPSPLKREAGAVPPTAFGTPGVGAGGDGDAERGRTMMESMRSAGLRSRSAGRRGGSRPPRSSVPAPSPDRRPPWNSGGNAGRKGLFSSPAGPSKRSNFAPHMKAKAPPDAAAASGTGSVPQTPSRDLHGEQDYVDMAIMMHLPITFGACYNKRNRPLLRSFNAGGSRPYVQQMVRSTTLQSWEVRDLREGDLFSFFIPFHKIGEERVTREIARLQRHMKKMRRGFLTTPQNQKGLRWFFYDMQHYILPKTEALLAELRDLVNTHGAQNLVFYLNIIRLHEQGRLQKERDAASPAAAQSPPAYADDGVGWEREGLLQEEVLTLSRGQYRDTVHCGNIIHVLEKLREYFAENFARGEVQVSDHLKDIEKEIRELEEKAARDVPGNEQVAEAEDNVESEYDDSESDGAAAAKPPPAGLSVVQLDQPGGANDADFSSVTASDVAANVERMRLMAGDDGSDVDPAAWRAQAPPLPAEDPRVSPPRRPPTGAAAGAGEWPQPPPPAPHDDFASDSTVSF